MIALRNLLRNKTRNLITLLGIAGGVGVFVAISSVTSDLGGQIRDAAGAYDMDIVILQEKAPSPFFSRISSVEMSELEGLFGDKVVPMVIGSLRESWNQYAFIMGMAKELAGRIPIVAGVHFRAGEKELIMGAHTAHRLGLEVGDSVSAGGEHWRVAGIFRTGSRLIDGGIAVDIYDAMRVLGRNPSEPYFNLALVHTGGAEKSSRAIEEINKRMPRLKAVRSVEFGGVLRIFQVIKTLSNILSGLALLGVCLVVTNTVLMGITERTGEVGILMSIGWRPIMILRMLFFETIIICMAGTLLGNLVGAGLLQAVNSQRVVDFGWIPLGIGLVPFLQSFLVGFGVTFVSLAWPAFVVLRLQPVEALRHA